MFLGVSYTPRSYFNPAHPLQSLSSGRREEAAVFQPAPLSSPTSWSVALGAMLQPPSVSHCVARRLSWLERCSAVSPAAALRASQDPALTYRFPRMKRKDAGASIQKNFRAVLRGWLRPFGVHCLKWQARDQGSFPRVAPNN